MKCFNNGTYPLYSSDKTQKKKGKTIYFHQVYNYDKTNYMKNYNGTICYDTSNNIKKAHSYNLLNSLRDGYNDCSNNCYIDGVTIDPAPDTQWNMHTKLDISNNLVDVSCNYILDSSCNFDFSYDAGHTASGYVKPSPGETSIIDPSNILFGDKDDCIKKKYMEYATLTAPSTVTERNGWRNRVGLRPTGKIKLK